MPDNLWTDAAHAQAYLDRADAVPHRQEGEATLVEFLPVAPARILDLGTGDGRLIAVALDARHRAQVLGLDVSPAMLAAARLRYADNPQVDIAEHDLTEPLPAFETAFDVVMSSFAIHHLDDDRKQTLYGEVFDRLAPGGMFLNLERVSSPTAHLHGAFLATLGETVDNEDRSNRLATLDVQLQWLRDIGFDDVDCHWKWRELCLFGGCKPSA